MLKPKLVPGRTFRVGVVGARRLDEANLDHLRLEIDRLLRDVDGQSTLDGEQTTPAMELICTLAEGAERLIADWAFKAGYELTVVLPFRQATYEEDFNGAASIAAFRALLAHAEDRVLELDGSRAEESRAYEAACRTVVRNSDLLIAIWDERSCSPRDTTELAVRIAVDSGPPVALMHPSDRRPIRWIDSPHDLVRGAPACRAIDRLPLYVHRLMALPDPPETGSGVLHRAARAVRRLVQEPIRIAAGLGPSQPVLGFLKAEDRPAWVPLKVYDALMAVIAWVPSSANARRRLDDDAPQLPPEADSWTIWFEHAERQARLFERRDSTATLLGFIGLGSALAAIALRPLLTADAGWVVDLEAGGAALAALLVIADAVFSWRAKAVSYRFVAEFCQIQQHLAPLGWRLPRIGGWASGMNERATDWRLPRIAPVAWEAWLYDAWLRDVRLPFGFLERDRVEMTRDAALHGMLREQMKVLERRAVRQHQISLRLRLVGEGCLLATAVIALLRYRMTGHVPLDEALGWMTRPSAILPAIAVATLGFVAWSRFGADAVRATLALRAVHRTRQRLAEMDCSAPLASQALGAELARLGQSLMKATQGWTGISRAGIDGFDQMFDPLEDAERAKEQMAINAEVAEAERERARMVPIPSVPLERLPRHRVPRGKIRLRQR